MIQIAKGNRSECKCIMIEIGTNESQILLITVRCDYYETN